MPVLAAALTINSLFGNWHRAMLRSFGVASDGIAN